MVGGARRVGLVEATTITITATAAAAATAEAEKKNRGPGIIEGPKQYLLSNQV